MAACMMIKAESDPDSTLAAQRLAFAQMILAIQNLDPAQIKLEAPSKKEKKEKKKKKTDTGFRIRASKVRTRCSRAHFCDYEEPEQTEEERRHALAQKLIAKTLRQADRRRRRRRVKIYPLCVRGWNIGLASFSPILTYLRWIRRQPWLRWARMLRNQYCTSRVTCCPAADESLGEPLLPLMTCELEC